MPRRRGDIAAGKMHAVSHGIRIRSREGKFHIPGDAHTELKILGDHKEALNVCATRRGRESGLF
jgi:hypothetical protein